MRRSIRNRLAELLLQAFEDPRRGDAIRWLRLFCDLAGREGRSEVSLADLLARGGTIFPGRAEGWGKVLISMIGTGRLFRVRRADTGEELAAGSSVHQGDVPWLIGLEPDARPSLAGVCKRASAYMKLLSASADFGSESSTSDPLQRAVAQAAACFNAGLFFEAHEHLEQFWRRQPRGQTRRFLQGLIQISVAFHHAQRGSYDGAVNQLTKGLEKTAGLTGEVLGLDCDAFLPGVAGSREAILAGGRGTMRPMPLLEIPRMRVVGTSRPQRQSGQMKARSEGRAVTGKPKRAEPER
jgi:hypothetical protein